MSQAERVAVVVGVGASAGLGGALARRFAREGLHVLLAGRTADRLESLAEEIRQAGGASTAVPTDTTQAQEVTALFERAETVGESLELVAYNAGNAAMGQLLDMEESFFEEVWRVTCLGGFLVGGEALVRNLQRGVAATKSFGGSIGSTVMPRSTSHVSQLPALLSEIGSDELIAFL